MRIAVLVKQIPKFEEMELGADGRLAARRHRARDEPVLPARGRARRASSRPSARARRVTVFTLGPPAADDTLREAIAWGLERDVDIDGVLVTDPAFAGSDTLATAKALAAALARDGPFDLVLTGRNSVDADTGQVGPELAELLDLPFLTGVRHLALDGDTRRRALRARRRLGAGRGRAARDPLVRRTAHATRRKVDPPGRAAVPADRIRRIGAADLGAGPWGQDASPTWVGPVKVMAVDRARRRWPDAPLAEQVAAALAALLANAARSTAERAAPTPAAVAAARSGAPPIDGRRRTRPRPRHPRAARRGRRARPATCSRSRVEPTRRRTCSSSWGADEIVHLVGANVEEDVARRGRRRWRATRTRGRSSRRRPRGAARSRHASPRASTPGSTGDAVELDVDDGRLIAWKPAFGGQLVAAIGCDSPTQMATVRAGVLPDTRPRAPVPTSSTYETIALEPRGRVRVLARTRDDDLDVLADADAVIGVGTGVAPDEYDALEPLRAAARRRARRDPQGHRQGLAPARPARSASPAARSRPACS